VERARDRRGSRSVWSDESENTSTYAVVYSYTIMRTNIEIDDELIKRAMRVYRLKTKREAVDLALRRLVAEPLDVQAAREMRGSGWFGDLAEMRSASRAAGT
jgi:Arc/MetJ family transcription regulator